MSHGAVRAAQAQEIWGRRHRLAHMRGRQPGPLLHVLGARGSEGGEVASHEPRGITRGLLGVLDPQPAAGRRTRVAAQAGQRQLHDRREALRGEGEARRAEVRKVGREVRFQVAVQGRRRAQALLHQCDEPGLIEQARFPREEAREGAAPHRLQRPPHVRVLAVRDEVERAAHQGGLHDATASPDSARAASGAKGSRGSARGLRGRAPIHLPVVFPVGCAERSSRAARCTRRGSTSKA